MLAKSEAASEQNKAAKILVLKFQQAQRGPRQTPGCRQAKVSRWKCRSFRLIFSPASVLNQPETYYGGNAYASGGFLRVNPGVASFDARA